jgi:hypothetical protein
MSGCRGASKTGISLAGILCLFEKHQQLLHRHAPSFIRHVLDTFWQGALSASEAVEPLGLSRSRLYGPDGRVPIGTQRLSIKRPPATKVVLCLHPTGHHSVLAAPPDVKAKPALLFTNRPK